MTLNELYEAYDTVQMLHSNEKTLGVLNDSAAAGLSPIDLKRADGVTLITLDGEMVRRAVYNDLATVSQVHVTRLTELGVELPGAAPVAPEAPVEQPPVNAKQIDPKTGLAIAA